jgi:MGT family glycosyltransferase
MSRPLRVVNRYRAAWRLPPLRRCGDTHSPYAQIVQLCPELDFPRRDLAATCHYVGSLAASRPCQDPFPWDRLDGRALIFASLGTLCGKNNLAAFRKIAAACAGLDAQLVIALGKWTEQTGNPRDQLSHLPGDPLVVDFAPQLALLEKAAVVITHAGLNTTLETLLHGVPMVALPRFADQPGVAARVEYAGAGLRASYRRFTAPQLRRLVQRLLAEPAFRERARHLQQALLATGGVGHAADIVEQAVATKRPVNRGRVG